MILLIILGLTAAYLYFTYVGIIKKRNGAQEALSGIDVQLAMRSSLIPNILTIAKKYMEHEKELLVNITAMRSRMDSPYDKSKPSEVSEHFAAASLLGEHMGKLQISMEAYPTLKADTQMSQAMKSYNETEAMIAAARRAYNATVTILNNAVQIFPSSAIASMISVQAMPFFETNEASKAPVNASDYL